MLLGRKFLRGAAAATVAACFVALVRPANAGEWVADANSLCQVWDPNPQIEESVVWSGACANGRAQGAGTAQWVRGGTVIETDKGEWRDGRQQGSGVQAWPAGRYEGEIADGEPNGRGVLTMQNLRYEGEFRDGKPNGTGSLSEGSQTVRGTWKDGCLQGGGRKASIGVPLSACR